MHNFQPNIAPLVERRNATLDPCVTLFCMTDISGSNSFCFFTLKIQSFHMCNLAHTEDKSSYGTHVVNHPLHDDHFDLYDMKMIDEKTF